MQTLFKKCVDFTLRIKEGFPNKYVSTYLVSKQVFGLAQSIYVGRSYTSYELSNWFLKDPGQPIGRLHISCLQKPIQLNSFKAIAWIPRSCEKKIL